MYARTTTVQGRPDRIDEGLALLREQVQPALEQMRGCIGMSALVDRESGGVIVTSSWESREAMRATEHEVGPMRDRASALFQDARPRVREWEIAVLHRERPAPPAACARVTWTRMVPEAVDGELEHFRMAVLPEIEAMPGFCSASLLVDRGTGDCALATVFEDRAALDAAREAAADLRSRTMARPAMTLLDVAHFEVAMAHLRVPETV